MAETKETKATAKASAVKKPAPAKKAAAKPVVKEAKKEAPAAKVASKPAAKTAKVTKEGSVKRPYRKSKQGVVVSTKMEKTIVVQVEDRSKHPLYGKVVKKFIKFKAHDEVNDARMGDTVRIVETRPLSATKRWRLAEIIERSK